MSRVIDRVRGLSLSERLVVLGSLASAAWSGWATWDGAFAGLSLFGETSMSSFESAAGDRQAAWGALAVLMSVIAVVILVACRKRHAARTVVAVVLVVGAVVSVRVGERARAAALDPWPRYERALASFPPIAEARLTQQNQGGHNDGEVPSADSVWQTDRPEPEVCAAVLDAFGQWAEDAKRDEGMSCFIRGRRAGAGAYAEVEFVEGMHVPPGTERPNGADGSVGIRVVIVAGDR